MTQTKFSAIICCWLLMLAVGCDFWGTQRAQQQARRAAIAQRDAERAAQEALQAAVSATPSSAPSQRMLFGRIVDLTHPFDERTIYWPTEDGFRLEPRARGVTDKGYFYAANRFTAAEHGGTHIDAPIHFFQDRETVDRIPLQRLIGDAVVVDVVEACSKDADYQITVADLHRSEEELGRQLVDVIVLLRTGYGRYWTDRAKYLGTEEVGEGAVAKLHFPGLAPEAAKWLVEQRMIKAVGIDTPSIDYGQSTHFQSHVTLFERNVPAFENVAQLEDLPRQGFTVIALPMKIGGGSGGPLRIVALLPGT
jgi:kynurenine formamidase